CGPGHDACGRWRERRRAAKDKRRRVHRHSRDHPKRGMPGYIWGAEVRRIFRAAKEGVSLAATLHAEGPDHAFTQICEGCGVPDADAAKIGYAVSLRSIGPWEEPTRRVVAALHEIDGVERGRPRARLLYRWDEDRDEFLKAKDGAASGRAGRA